MSWRTLANPLTSHDPLRIGSYALLGRLGSGAMGRVYLGRSAGGRLVAVKTIRGDLADDPDFRTRFAHEVAAARQVSGAFTAPVVAADPDSSAPWLATSYVAAPSLERMVRTCGPLPVDTVRWLAAGCAEALESIQSVGLIHRDLKPSNVLVALDGPRVIDFGVARATSRDSLTQSRQPIGTPAYMAPEQARETRRTTAASDVFSLGSTLLFAATGHPPYQGDSVTEILLKLATGEPDLSGLPAELAAIVGACLQPVPADRPTAADLLAELAGDAFQEAPLPASAVALIESYRPHSGAGTTSPPAGKADSITLVPPPSLPREAEDTVSGRRPTITTLALIGAAILLLVVGGVAGTLLNRGGGSQTPQRQSQLPGAPPPVPVSGLDATLGGTPTIASNQPMGDGNTEFVIHGTGFRPGVTVTLSLDHRRSRVTEVVDRTGTFNYTVDQGHIFYPGKLPPGDHSVEVDGSDGSRARTKFSVNPL